MIDDEKKSEVRTYYETHRCEVKDLSEKFQISVRTLYAWIRKEDWQAGRFVKSGEVALKDDMLQCEIGSRLDYLKRTVANEIQSDLEKVGVRANKEMVEARSEEVLLEALSARYIDMSMAEVAVLAKKNFKEMVCDGTKPERVIGAAKEVVNIYATLKQSIHGREPTNVVHIANFNGNMSSADMASLSDDELRKLILESSDE